MNITTETWGKLNSNPNRDGFANSIPVVNGNVYALLFIGSDESYHCLIKIDFPLPVEPINPNSIGITTEIHRGLYSQKRKTRDDYLDISCANEIYLEFFSQMITEIIHEITQKNLHPVKVANQLITKYKRFWSKKNNELLSAEEEIGLFAELKVLYFLVKNFPAQSAVTSWKGPERFKYDFDFFNKSIEVKSTLKNNHEHKINGLEQLEKKKNGELYLVSMKLLEVDSTNGENLKILIDKISEVIQDDPEAYEVFIEKLGLTKYKEEHEYEYKFYTEEAIVFLVDGDFPLITQSSFKEELSSRIKNFTYVLNLEGLEGKVMDSNSFKDNIKDSLV